MKTTVLNYRVLIDKEHYEDGSTVFVAHVPTLGISDYGDSKEDVLESLKDGIRLAIDSLKRAGKEIPDDNITDQIITSLHIPFSQTNCPSLS